MKRKSTADYLFLDVLFIQNYDEINAATCRKSTLENIYAYYLEKRSTAHPNKKNLYNLVWGSFILIGTQSF